MIVWFSFDVSRVGLPCPPNRKEIPIFRGRFFFLTQLFHWHYRLYQYVSIVGLSHHCTNPRQGFLKNTLQIYFTAIHNSLFLSLFLYFRHSLKTGRVIQMISKYRTLTFFLKIFFSHTEISNILNYSTKLPSTIVLHHVS